MRFYENLRFNHLVQGYIKRPDKIYYRSTGSYLFIIMQVVLVYGYLDLYAQFFNKLPYWSERVRSMKNMIDILITIITNLERRKDPTKRVV